MLPYLYIAIYIAATLVSFWGRQEVMTFLSAHATIANEESLEAFKRMARRNMPVTLPFAVMMIAGLGVGMRLLSQQPISVLVLCIAANVAFFLLPRNFRKMEIYSCELPCPDPTLASEYARVSKSWLPKLWPDF